MGWFYSIVYRFYLDNYEINLEIRLKEKVVDVNLLNVIGISF